MKIYALEQRRPAWPATTLATEPGRYRNAWDEPENDPWVLVVDDDPANRKLARFILRTENMPVREAADGYAALHLLRSTKGCCLVLTDYEMPGMNGDTLASRIRQSHPTLPIMLLTGLDEITREHIDQWQIQALLHKPYEIETLLGLVRELVRGNAK